jgi:hypothetical protein
MSKQDWKGVLSGVHQHSKGVLHAASSTNVAQMSSSITVEQQLLQQCPKVTAALM